MDLDESSLLDVLDHVLSKGVMASGDLTLGVAGIDLIYVRLSALLCSAEKVLPSASDRPRPRSTPRSRRKPRTS
jgi:gas vesicle structural protein